jgi:hypothetical protein
MLDVDALNAAAGHLDNAAARLRGFDDQRLEDAARELASTAVAFDLEPDATWLDHVEAKGTC